jgi:anti-anti-sigma factor
MLQRGGFMPLTVTVRERESGVFVVSPAGSLDTNTCNILEKRLDMVLEGSTKAIVFDMEELDYISSMGVRVIVRARKALKDKDAYLVMMNLQPQIKKVFDIIKALPGHQVFSNVEELDNYLTRIQKKMTE